MSKFDLNEYIKLVSLDKINVINLTYYALKSEIMNIYDTNFEFDENIIPLVTSVLEIDPHIINAKRYCNVNSESIIIIGNKNDLPNKSQISYPCFFSDLQQNKLNIQNIQGYTKKLIATLETDFSDIKIDLEDEILNNKILNNEVLNNEVLIRMYKLENKKGEFGNCILNEEELIIFVWSWEYANFQIIINKEKPKICQLQINIYVTEENKFITSKLENINDIIDKINKIKNEMVSRLQ
jgi:hypothetical protein